MEIIKQGITPKDWTLDITCPSCKSVLRVSCNDIRLTTRMGVLNFKRIMEYTTHCKKCDSKLWINEKLIPQIIHKHLVDRMSFDQYLLNFYF